MENTAEKKGGKVRMVFLGLVFLVLALLYFTTWVNYLLFHVLAEIFSIVVAAAFFMITWNSRRFMQNEYVSFIGIAYLFIAFLDLMHTLSYKGMPLFSDYDYYANQLWIGARYMESLTLLTGFLFLKRKRGMSPSAELRVYAVITAAIILSVFVWKVFPVCFVDGIGLTPFKKDSEYIISSILAVCIWLLSRYKDRFEAGVYRLLLLSLICTIVSELAFTFYVNNYGFSNLVGHYFKIFSFYFVYKAVIETGVAEPYNLIFRELIVANRNLRDEVAARIASEKEKEVLIAELRETMSQVKRLSGLLPICSGCKKIRDDRGYWGQVEEYISKHSEATFSHSLCPDCMERLYPEFIPKKNGEPEEG